MASGDTSIRYVITRGDQIAKLQRYAGRSSVARWFPAIAYLAIVSLSWFSAFLFYVRQGDENYLYLASGLLAIFLTVCLPWLYRRYQDSFFGSVMTDDNLRGLIGPRELLIGDVYLEEIGDRTRLLASWHDILGIEESADRLFIGIAPMVEIVVPTTAFADDQARHEFVELLNSKLAD